MTAVTTRLDTRFLVPAEPGRLEAIARVISTTDRSAEVHAELLDAGQRKVAVAIAEMRIVERRGSSGA
jgi:acyl-coenzyme A thioesterase PaaI-like protein